MLDLTGAKLPPPTEDQEQIALVNWARMQEKKYPELRLLFHIPNGGSRGKAEAGRFRAMGVRAGVPDLCLPVPVGGYNGLYIELKRTQGGRVSKDQAAWLDALQRRGYRAVVCYGWEEAASEILAYVRMDAPER